MMSPDKKDERHENRQLFILKAQKTLEMTMEIKAKRNNFNF